MLKQRVITALILLAILLPALFNSSELPFLIVSALFISAAAWEWGRLNGYGQVGSVLSGLLSAVTAYCLWRFGLVNSKLTSLWIIVGALWVIIALWVLHRGVDAWSGYQRNIRLIVGFFALSLAWLGVAQARMVGVNFLVSILTLVWVADIAAYFSGKMLGGHFFRLKLAPLISPGKSWEGVVGGILGVLALSYLWCRVDTHRDSISLSFYSYLEKSGLFFLLITVIFMTAMSIVGDLLESLVKRSARVKDSSGLLPGHGGVLDRIDALLPTLPLAMMIYSVINNW
jgi:phosphatidate cytidylyltransferase